MTRPFNEGPRLSGNVVSIGNARLRRLFRKRDAAAAALIAAEAELEAECKLYSAARGCIMPLRKEAIRQEIGA